MAYAGMSRKGEGYPPISNRRTSYFSDKRLAKAHPAEPPPTEIIILIN